MSEHRIVVIGNHGAGTTALARRLADTFEVPLHHVDEIDPLDGSASLDEKALSTILDELALRRRWVIEGTGPLSTLEQRIERATSIVFVDLPRWRFVLAAARQELRRLSQLPFERACKRAAGVLGAMWTFQREVRPWLRKELAQPSFAHRVTRVRDLESWRRVFYWTPADHR